MLKRILLDTEEVLVTLGLFGGLKVTSMQPYPRTIKATPFEKAYFFSAVDQFERNGKLSPNNSGFQNFVEEFALHIAVRGDTGWTAFFTQMDPKVWAADTIDNDNSQSIGAEMPRRSPKSEEANHRSYVDEHVDGTIAEGDLKRLVACYLTPDSLSHKGQATFVLIAGAAAVGKTELRRKNYSSGYVVLDAAEIFLDLCQGQYYDFPSIFEDQMNAIGSEVCQRAFAEKRNIVCEVIGDDSELIVGLIESIKLAGYKVEMITVTCDFEESSRRNLSRCDDEISSYYAQEYHLKWILDAFNEKRASGQVREVQTTRLPFKSSTAAFSHACKLMDNNLCEKAELPALVISTSTFEFKEFTCISVKVASEDGGTLAIAMVNQITMERLRKDDLVSWVALKEIPFSDDDQEPEFCIWLGMITDKLQPTLDIEKGWVINTA